ncbi:acyl-CoA thioesterase [Ramlibacter sp. PS3R-8]|uniref:acyl-CoA thioesterase n=1 Tax=Ramlibacter sp. PS3R-8 TaxID=3133437 RepID=UPI00309C91E5
MARTVSYAVRVEFGHCDPARIVWFPNFYRWIDHASRHFFIECGVPPWHETEKTMGVIGTPIVDSHSRFLKTATYGDELVFEVSIPEWRGKSFVQRYRCVRGADVIMECDEVRIFAGRKEGEPEAIRALPIPEDIKKLCA